MTRTCSTTNFAAITSPVSRLVLRELSKVRESDTSDDICWISVLPAVVEVAELSAVVEGGGNETMIGEVVVAVIDSTGWILMLVGTEVEVDAASEGTCAFLVGAALSILSQGQVLSAFWDKLSMSFAR